MCREKKQITFILMWLFTPDLMGRKVESSSQHLSVFYAVDVFSSPQISPAEEIMKSKVGGRLKQYHEKMGADLKH